MKTLFNENGKIKRIFIILSFSFIIVFLLRFGYEMFFFGHDIVISYDHTNYGSNVYMESEDYSSRVVVKNIATDQINQKDHTGQDITIDQKYEKSADISAITSDFKNDNESLRNIISQYDAVIQSENLSGLEGRQGLSIKIGVVPDNFDAIIESIKTIGTLQTFTVNKEDKTAEFKSLLAEQQTLEKTRDSCIAMKEKGGNIQDLLLLEEKILEVEKNLQNLGVNIGTYDAENSFCTINFALTEAAGAVKETSLKLGLKCAKRSFLWTVGIYALVGVLALCTLAAIVLFLKLTVSLKKTIMSTSASAEAGYSRKNSIPDNPQNNPRKDSSGEA